MISKGIGANGRRVIIDDVTRSACFSRQQHEKFDVFDEKR